MGEPAYQEGEPLETLQPALLSLPPALPPAFLLLAVALLPLRLPWQRRRQPPPVHTLQRRRENEEEEQEEGGREEEVDRLLSTIGAVRMSGKEGSRGRASTVGR